MKRTYQQILFTGVVFGLSCQMGVASCLENNDGNPPTISVSGNAEIQIEPDHAVFSFSISTQASTLDSVLQTNDAKVQAIIKFLQSSGIESDSIHQQPLDINPVHENKSVWKGKGLVQAQVQSAQSINAPPLNAIPVNSKQSKQTTPSGFRASRSISVKLSKLASVELISRGLIERGVYNASDVSFRSSELEKHRDAARLKAIQNAKEKATAMANQLGAKLDRVKSIQEGASNDHWRSRSTSFLLPSVPMPTRISEAPFGATMITVSASANVVFILGETGLDTDN